MRWLSRLAAMLVAVAVIASGGVAGAAFIKIDDFDALTPGDINGQNSWVRTAGTGQVVADPAVASNQVLAVSGVSNLYRPATILQGNTGTLFFRMRINGQQNLSVGLSDISAPAAFGDYESQINMSNSTSVLRVRHGGNFVNIATLSQDVWYNFWMVPDNQVDTYKLYMNTGTGGANSTHQLKSGSVENFNFRNGVATNDLIRLFVKTDNGHNGTMFLDDFYLDATNVNLANPVPEPAAWGLLALGLAAVAPLALRRRTPH